MAERILIWGAGAIGGSVGAWLKRAGHDITFVDVVPEHVAAIRDTGLHITGPVEEFIVHASAFTREELTGTWQRIFLSVKAQHTEAATRSLTPHLAQDGYVLSLQNGLNERIIQRIVGRDRTIGAFINFGADWMAPGEIMFGNRGAVVLGELDAAMTPRLEALLGVMRDFEPDAVTTPNIWSYLWGKLGYGAILFAQALGQKGIKDLLKDVDLYKVGHHGSRNATPKDLWNQFSKRKSKRKKGALKTLMSTSAGVYGKTEETKVPATRLVRALETESELSNTQKLKTGRGPIVIEI